MISGTNLHVIVEQGSSQGDNETSMRVEAEIAQGPNLDINATDGTGRTALHIAAHKNMKQTVVTLLNRGANPAIKSNSGKTALDDAQTLGAHDAVDILSNLSN